MSEDISDSDLDDVLDDVIDDAKKSQAPADAEIGNCPRCNSDEAFAKDENSQDFCPTCGYMPSDDDSDKLDKGPKPDPVTEAFEQILFLLTEVSKPNADVRKFRNTITAPVLVVARSDRSGDLASFVSLQVAKKVFHPKAAEFCLVGLAQRSDVGRRMYLAKTAIDTEDLRNQVTEFLSGKREWADVVPVAKVVATDDNKPKDDSANTSNKPAGAVNIKPAVQAVADKDVFDWKKAEADLAPDVRDPSWRPEVAPSGDAVLDSLRADLALIESWQTP